MLVGYARVSTPDQDPAYQLRALEESGCQRIFTDRASGRITERPQLTAALEFLRDGDTLVVWKFDRLARNLRHLIELGVEFERRRCQLVSLTEAIDTDGLARRQAGVRGVRCHGGIRGGPEPGADPGIRPGPQGRRQALGPTVPIPRSGERPGREGHAGRSQHPADRGRPAIRRGHHGDLSVVPRWRPRRLHRRGTPPKENRMTVGEACGAYLRDLEARNIRKSTRANYRTLFRQLQAFAIAGGIESLTGIDRDAVRSWREQWDCAASTHRRRLAQLKPFFSYAAGEGWISDSPLKGVRSPKSDARPTMPLSSQEMHALLVAAKPRPREHALLLLLRYSGLAIRDGVTVGRGDIHGDGDLVLRRAKSGELVTVALPLTVLASLDAISRRGQPYFFWTGQGAAATAANYWRARLKRIASEAGVEGFTPHRLRDTFAVELLLAGVMTQDVSSLLGHRSVATTEQYYAPWNRARRERLGRIIREVHQQDPLLLAFTSKKPVGSVGADPTGASLATQVPKPTQLAQGST